MPSEIVRKSVKVTVAGKEVTIYELTVAQIKKFYRELTNVALDGSTDFPGTIQGLLEVCSSGITFAEFDDLTPSQIKEIYDKFKEINKTFFTVAAMVGGEHPVLVEIRASFLTELINRFVSYYQPGTDSQT